MTQEMVVRSDHHVLVLGPGASWKRNTQSFPPHRPYSQAGIVWDKRATNLMNYRRKLAVFDYSCLERLDRMDLWVFEDDRQCWTKKTFSLPISNLYIIFVGDLFLQGTSHEGKIRCFIQHGLPVTLNMICDLETCKFVQGFLSNKLPRPQVQSLLPNYYWDDFESIMYLET
ncbi:hypothetical protein DY000_02055861 [Brassica cretica]|uniref:F-box associated beta-propeller type 3 domain-containing protein n=1 Tax=Brassica cretica TaxID=69181 RepID=A0ABQ7AID0_BRACR|nr:hypothetical protein DY000_02055861 [Brassica cretica]